MKETIKKIISENLRFYSYNASDECIDDMTEEIVTYFINLDLGAE